MAPPRRKRARLGLGADTTSRVVVVWGLLGLLILGAVLSRPLWLGLLVLVIALGAFGGVSYLIARTLVRLPFLSPADYRDGWRAFLGWLLGLHRSSYLVENLTVRRTLRGGAHLLPGVVLVDAHSVIVTRRFDRHYRVLGPGVHFRRRAEVIPVEGDGTRAAKVREVVDLRRQFRSMPLTAQARDGMFFTTTLSATFQIDRDPDPALDEHSYLRFYDAAVHRAVSAERIGSAPGEVFDWTSLPLALAQDAALQILSTYALDDLYAPRGDHHGFRPLEMRLAIGAQIADAIRVALLQHGIQLLSIGLAPIAPADKRVTHQRVLNWRATHQRDVTAHEALSLATVETMREEARGKAQARLLQAILTGLGSARGQSRALLQLRLAAALERMFAPAPGEAAPIDASPSSTEPG